MHCVSSSRKPWEYLAAAWQADINNDAMQWKMLSSTWDSHSAIREHQTHLLIANRPAADLGIDGTDLFAADSEQTILEVSIEVSCIHLVGHLSKRIQCPSSAGGNANVTVIALQGDQTMTLQTVIFHECVTLVFHLRLSINLLPTDSSH